MGGRNWTWGFTRWWDRLERGEDQALRETLILLFLIGIFVVLLVKL